MIHYLACDGNGVDSISDVLSKKTEITHVPISSYEEFDRYVASIVNKVTPKDLVILDTLNMLATMTRGDMSLGTDPLANLWDLRGKITGNKNHGADYEATGQMIMRRLKNLCRNGQGARIIVACHEAEKMDESTIPPTKKRGPDVNPALLGALLGSSSDVFRLFTVKEEITNDEGKILIPVGTRVLQLKETDEVIAKCQVPMSMVGKIKKALPNPTLPALYEHIGKKPTWCTIYGASGAGKSTFCTSELRT